MTSGPGRYVGALLRALHDADFEVVIFGCDQAGIDGEGGVKLRKRVRIFRANAEDAGSSDGQGENVRLTNRRGRLQAVRTVYRRCVPFPARFAVGTARHALEMARLIRHERLDLFHAQHVGVIEEASFASRLAGVPRILGTLHMEPSVDVDGRRSNGIFRLLQCIGNQSPHYAIAVSESTRRAWSQRSWLPDYRTTTVHNGVDPMQFRRNRSRSEARAALGLAADDRLLVGAAGRLHPQKGFEYLIQAVALLTADFPQLALVLAGEGDLNADLRSLASSLGIADRVIMPGFCADVRIVYDAVDIFAMSSLCEALPYALLEAMSHELPVVATSVGGVPEVVVPGATGFLARPRDAVALAAALRPILESAEQRRRMGAAGRQRVIERFNERDCVEKTIAIYRELLGG